MSLWIILVILGQFIYACVALIDKFIVTSKSVVLQPFSYAFFISVLSSLSVVVFFFGFIPLNFGQLSIPSFSELYLPSIKVILFSFLAGYAFFGALYTLYITLAKVDASDAMPVVGSVNAFLALIFSVYYFNNILTTSFLWAFIFLVLGMIILSRFRFIFNTLLIAVFSGILFAFYNIFTKLVFENTNFDSGFLWTRLALAFAAFSSLLIPWCRKHVHSHVRMAKKQDGLIVIGNKILGGLGSIILLKALQLGDVALVQALGALQYVFLLILSVSVGHLLHRDFGENNTKTDIVHKLVAIPLIIFGFFLLFFNM